MQNYRIRDIREPNYYYQNATPFQQIRPYDDQQTIKYLFLKRESGEGEGIRARQEATNDYLQEGTVPRQNVSTPSKQRGNPPMQRRLLLLSLSSPTLTKRHQRTPQPVKSNPENLPKTRHYDGSTNWDACFVKFTDMLTLCSAKPQNEETSYVGVLKAKLESITLS